jgi:hypothetical protein
MTLTQQGHSRGSYFGSIGQSKLRCKNLTRNLKYESILMKAYYINLDRRPDRRKHIENEFRKQGTVIDYERIEAVDMPDFGNLGCTDSHIIAMEKFISGEEEYCIIFEDDFFFTRKFSKSFKFPECEWDVILISGNVLDAIDCGVPGFKKVIDAQACSGYIVHRNFAPKLLANFKEGRDLLSEHKDIPKHAIDIYWKLLQPTSRWFVCEPKFGIQAPGYSDIQGCYTSYGV